MQQLVTADPESSRDMHTSHGQQCALGTWAAHASNSKKLPASLATVPEECLLVGIDLVEFDWRRKLFSSCPIQSHRFLVLRLDPKP